VELLVVVLIIGILLALLVGSLGSVWDCVSDTQCKYNLNQLYKALYGRGDARLPSPPYWVGYIQAVGAGSALVCPTGETSQSEEQTSAPSPDLPSVPPGTDDEDVVLPPPKDSDLEQDLTMVDMPPSVAPIGANGALQSDTQIRMFREQQAFTLPSSVRTTVSSPGKYSSYTSGGGGSVAGGTKVDCYFIHFDPVNSGGRDASGSMSFSGDILGIVCCDADLNASDSVLGAPGTKYPTGTKSRGFESSGQEVISISADKRTLIIHRFYSTGCGEQCRVIIDARSKEDDAGSTGWEKGGGPGSVYGAGGSDEDFGVGGATSYAMNNQVTTQGAWPGQILVLEYHRGLADFDGRGCDDKFETQIAPRHRGYVNVLFCDGEVRSMTPRELEPKAHPNLWESRFGGRP
jgi:prepilin-type processing-associated H-X9-DG protein